MSDAAFPFVVDVRTLALASERLAGESALSEFGRLADEAQGEVTGLTLRWSVQAGMGVGATGAAEPWLHLAVSTCIPLTCQRCLGPVETELDILRSFRFVETEALAEAQDEESEEDVLAISAEFSLASLIEDEVLLALPLIPRHEACPSPVRMSAQDTGFEEKEGPRPNPFAALAGLSVKTDKSSH